MVMHARLAYCSGCDRQVRVIVNPRVLKEGREPTEKDLICLEHGESCSGQLCPLFDVPSAEMKERYGDLIEQAKDELEEE